MAYVVVLLVVAGGMFYAGMSYGQSKTTVNNQNQDGNRFTNLTPDQRQARIQQFGGGRGENGNRGGFISGEILSKDDKSITVKLPDGGSTIVFLSDKTNVSKSISSSISNLSTGTQVTVNGTKNQNGSISANVIQIRSNISNNQTRANQ